MKIYYIFLYCVAILLIADWQIETMPGGLASAQGCTNPPILIGPRWTQGATLTIKISDQFTAEERNSILQAFNDWNAEWPGDCSNVYFDTPNAQVVSEEPAPAPYLQWVGYDPSTTGNVAVAYLNSSMHGRMIFSGRIRLCNRV